LNIFPLKLCNDAVFPINHLTFPILFFFFFQCVRRCADLSRVQTRDYLRICEDSQNLCRTWMLLPLVIRLINIRSSTSILLKLQINGVITSIIYFCFFLNLPKKFIKSNCVQRDGWNKLHFRMGIWYHSLRRWSLLHRPSFLSMINEFWEQI